MSCSNLSRVFVSVGLTLTLVHCTTPDNGRGGGATNQDPLTGGAGTAPSGLAGSGAAGTQATITAGSGGALATSGTGGSAGAGNNYTPKQGLPPDVCKVLQNNGCITCHQTPMQGTAPMALQWRDDFARNALDGTPLAPRVIARVQDVRTPMPPASSGNPMLSATDVTTLRSWFDGGMPGVVGGSACLEPTSGNPDTGPGWATNDWPADQCEWVMTIGAHGNAALPLAQDPTPFTIPADHTHYECFYEKVPWGSTPVQALAIRARIETDDDKKIVHHFVASGLQLGDMSAFGAAPNNPGDHKQCDNPSGFTVGIYAPGAYNPLAYPPDVGVVMPSGDSAYMELQIHYNNLSMQPAQSRAQYDICVSSKKRANTAGVFWLGYENANFQTLSGLEMLARLDNQNNGSAVGKCQAKERTRILSIMPHMHSEGRQAKMEILRKDGTVDTVLDQSFNYQDQTSYFRNNLWVEQGETVRSSCTWDKGPVYFGFATDFEMCFLYTLAYPLEGFKPGFGEKGFVGGDLACAAQAGP